MKMTQARFSYGHKTGFLRNERGQYELVVFGANRHFAAILLRDMTN